MAKILYSASTAQGERTEGFVEAMSAASARSLLKHQGLREIVLHEEPAIAHNTEVLKGLSAAEEKALARFRLRVMRSPGLATALAEVARNTRWWLLGAAAVVVWGLYSGDVRLVVGSVVAAGLPFAVTAWRWRHVGRYQQLLKELAVGHWSAARQLAAQLRSVSKSQPVMDFDLDVRLAGIDARDGDLGAALQSVEPWRDKLAAQPGLYECRVATIHLSGGDNAGYVRLMGEAADLAGGDPSRSLDHALAQARFGDPQVASALLSGLDAGLLPPHASGFIKWTRGFLQLRQGSPDAAATLGEAVADFLRLAEQPTVWTALAVCACDHAVALNQAGQQGAARRQIASVWPVLKAQAPESLLRMLDGDGLLPTHNTGGTHSRRPTRH